MLMKIVLAIIAILLFGIVIFIHELGHFIVAKLSGVTVNEFALGMGPTLFKFYKGETKYALRLFPIGGFCAMEGEEEKSDKSGSYSEKPAWKRFGIIVAGAIMNLILGYILFFAIFVQDNKFTTMTIKSFKEEATSCQTGLQVGDTIKKVEGYKVVTLQDLGIALFMAPNDTCMVQVDRDGQSVTLDAVKFIEKEVTNERIIKVADFTVETVDKNFGTLFVYTFNESISTVRTVWVSLAALVTGHVSISELSGPIGIVSAMATAASKGLESGDAWQGFVNALNNILSMMGMITINLGVVNLLPIPALDGGRLVFIIIEWIRGKPINPKRENIIHTAGFVLVILLMVFLAFSDVFRLFTGKGIG